MQPVRRVEDRNLPRPAIASFNYLTGRVIYRSPRDPSLVPGRPVVLSAVAVRLSDVEPREVRWLWRPMIPLGKLTILCGDPGLGKSYLTLAFAARVSAGLPMPGQGDCGLRNAECGLKGPEPSASAQSAIPNPQSAIEPGDVVLLSAEDDAADTIRPRLIAMGGDAARIHVLQGLRDQYGVNPTDFAIGEHAAHLGRFLSTLERPRLVVIDPISAFVGGTESYNNAQVRAMLKPLAELAADRAVAVLLVTHLRKGEAGRMLYRAMGSLAFTAAARAVLCLTRDPADPDRRLLLPVKNNLGADRLGYALRITEGRVEFDPEPLTGTADEIMRERAERAGPPEDRARQILRETLARGPLPVREVEARLAAAGIPVWLSKRHGFKEAMGIVSRKIGREWHWALTGEAAASDPQG